MLDQIESVRAWLSTTGAWEPAFEQVLSSVVTWRPAKPGSRLHRPEPFASQLSGNGRPVEFCDRATAGQDDPVDWFGYDAAGAIVAAREVTVGDGRQVMGTDTSVRLPAGPGDDRWVTRHGLRDGLLQLSARVSTVGAAGQVMAVVDVARTLRGWQAQGESYRWEHDRPVAKQWWWWREWMLEEGADPEAGSFRAEYEEDGALRALVREEPDGDVVVWSRPSGARHATLVGRWRRAVQRALVEQLAAHVNSRPLYGLTLLYELDDPASVTGVAWLAPRAEIADAAGAPRALAYWNPAEALAAGGGVELPLATDPEIGVLAAQLQMAPDRDIGAERAALVVVAKRGTARGWWPAEVQQADDFAIWAVDVELEDLEESLVAALPRAAFRRFQSQGWMPT